MGEPAQRQPLVFHAVLRAENRHELGGRPRCAGHWRIGEILQDFMTQTLDTGGAVSSASTDSIVDSTGTWSVGGFIMSNTGEAAQILTESDRQIFPDQVARYNQHHASAWDTIREFLALASA